MISELYVLQYWPGLKKTDTIFNLQALRELQTTFTNVRLQLRDANIKVFKLEREVKEYKQHVSKGKAADTKQRAKASATGPAHAEADHIGLYARKFAVMNEYSVVPGAFLVQRPKDLRSDNLCQWDTQEDALHSIIVELYEELPEDLHEMLVSQFVSFHGKTQMRHAIDLIFSHSYSIYSSCLNSMPFVVLLSINFVPKQSLKYSTVTLCYGTVQPTTEKTYLSFGMKYSFLERTSSLFLHRFSFQTGKEICD